MRELAAASRAQLVLHEKRFQPGTEAFKLITRKPPQGMAERAAPGGAREIGKADGSIGGESQSITADSKPQVRARCLQTRVVRVPGLAHLSPPLRPILRPVRTYGEPSRNPFSIKGCKKTGQCAGANAGGAVFGLDLPRLLCMM